MIPWRQRLNRIGWACIATAVLVFLVGYVVAKPRFKPVVFDQDQAAFAEAYQWSLALTNEIGIVLRLIPAGFYHRGSPNDERGRSRDEFRHPIRVAEPFYMAVTETTQRQFENVMGYNPSYFEKTADAPVEYVTWEEALRFCNALSEREGLKQAYSVQDEVWIWDEQADGYRLPVEAEWEFAARAGTSTAFYTGDAKHLVQTRKHAWRAAWMRSNAHGSTQPVGLREPNAWGLYDMSGNVWEWCWDRYAPYPVTIDPPFAGPSEGEQRSVRGGSWYSAWKDVRSASRQGRDPATPGNSVGFRVVRSVISLPDSE